LNAKEPETLVGGRGGGIGVVAINLDAQTRHVVYKLSYLNVSLQEPVYTVAMQSTFPASADCC